MRSRRARLPIRSISRANMPKPSLPFKPLLVLAATAKSKLNLLGLQLGNGHVVSVYQLPTHDKLPVGWRQRVCRSQRRDAPSFRVSASSLRVTFTVSPAIVCSRCCSTPIWPVPTQPKCTPMPMLSGNSPRALRSALQAAIVSNIKKAQESA